MKKSRKKRLTRKTILIGLSCTIILLIIILFFVIQAPNTYAENEFRTIDPQTQKLANTYIEIWKDSERREHCLADLYQQNPEWDFMFRTYSVLAFSNLALHTPDRKQEYITLIDLIIDSTLETEQQHGFKYFLMRYGYAGGWIDHPARSQFIDGEIALMLAVRCLIEDKIEYRKLLKQRIDTMSERMERSPVLCAESYPDECWIFCNTISLAAIKISDILNQTDHSELINRWVKVARKNLLDSQTSLLRSAFCYDGTPVPSAKGPEGSSIWMSCHMLQIVDEEFAQQQYTIAKEELMDSILGLGYSREWPKNSQANPDIDSGPLVPVLKASPSASGLGLIAAASFKDQVTFNRLTKSLNTLAFPKEQDGCLFYELSNPLGDAVILYGLTVGPVWEKVNIDKTP